MEEEKIQLKDVYVEAKKSKNFQTYTVGGTISIDESESKEITDAMIKRAQARCRKLVVEQIKLDGPR